MRLEGRVKVKLEGDQRQIILYTNFGLNLGLRTPRIVGERLFGATSAWLALDQLSTCCATTIVTLGRSGDSITEANPLRFACAICDGLQMVNLSEFYSSFRNGADEMVASIRGLAPEFEAVTRDYIDPLLASLVTGVAVEALLAALDVAVAEGEQIERELALPELIP